MECLKSLLEQNKKNEMLQYFDSKTTMSNEELNLVCVAILKDYKKETDLKYVKLILSFETPNNENSFNLRVRLATLISKNEIIKLFKFAQANDISIKKRSIVPVINFALQLEDTNWIKELYDYANSNKLILDQSVYFNILSYFGNLELGDHFDKVLRDLVTVHEVINEDLSLLIQHYYSFSVQQTKITRRGCCKKCGTVFNQSKMTRRQQFYIKDIIRHNIAGNRRQFIDFVRFIENNQCFLDIDYIIDGANVGYYDQRPDLGGKLNYRNIDRVCKKLSGKKIIFLHEMHNKNNPFVKSWKAQNLVYFTPRGMNDDWFWLFLAIHNLKSRVISNDKICDHFFKCEHNTAFKKWRDLTMVTFNITHSHVNFRFPKNYRNETQYGELKWHIPVHNNMWLCIDN